MFRKLMVLSALLLCVSPLQAADLTGRQIIDEVSKRHDSKFEFEEQQMVLVSSKGTKEVRKVRRYKRDTEDGGKHLLVFHSPAGVKGTSLLTWQYDAKDDERWLYLPAMGDKLKRIAKGGQRNYFMGTDYTFEDLASEARDKFAYERLGDETIGDNNTFKIKVVPIDKALKKETGYSYRTMWVRQDIFFIIRIDYFNRRNKLIKRQEYKELENVSGGMWRARVSVMKNLAKKHVTLIKTLNRSFDEAKVPETSFTSRFLTTGQHLR